MTFTEASRNYRPNISEQFATSGWRRDGIGARHRLYRLCAMLPCGRHLELKQVLVGTETVLELHCNSAGRVNKCDAFARVKKVAACKTIHTRVK